MLNVTAQRLILHNILKLAEMLEVHPADVVYALQAPH